MGDITLVGLGHFVLGLVLSFDIVLHKDRPVSAVLWLAVVWALPYLGTLAYLSVGIDRVRRGAAERRTARELVARRAALHPEFDRLTVDEFRRDPFSDESFPGRYIFRGTDPAVRPNRVMIGNRVRLLVDGDQYYPALMGAIETASHSVHLQTFIFGRGRIGDEILDRLIDRVGAGVQVRLLYDRFGSTFAHFSGLFNRARAAGVRVASISQANPLKGRFQINLRNHRKIAIIDGQVGFVGGINIHDDNISRDGRETAIRDYQVQLEGPAVSDLQLQFIEDWYFATREPPERMMSAEHFPEARRVGDALVQIVPGGPERRGRGLADAFFAAIVAAQHSITIATPYFVPDEPILEALRFAAHRGVRVHLIVPRKSNHWYTGFAARALYDRLLQAGVRIFERAPPFMHAKALVVDDIYAMLGSANMDYRSLHLNFETNVEIADAEFVRCVVRQLGSEIERSEEVEYATHRARPVPIRLVENFCRLFQPML